jgi:hypothetical protein
MFVCPGFVLVLFPYFIVPCDAIDHSVLTCSGSEIKYYQGKANMDWTGLLARISQNPTKFWNGTTVV